jgi:MFS family permease
MALHGAAAHEPMAALGAGAASDRVRRTAWSAVLLLAAVLFAGGLLRTVFSPLQEAAKLDLKLSDFGISLAQGLATGAPVAAVTVPLAWVIDHGRRVRLLVALFAVCVVGTLWTCFATGLASLFLARMLSAIGASCAIPVIISLVADLCAPDHRGRAMVVAGLGSYAGAAAAFMLGGWLLSALARHPLAALCALAPWRGAHLIVGIAGAVLLLPLAFLREPVRHEVEVQGAALGPTMRALWAKRAFLGPLFMGQIGISMADAAASIWATPVLIRSYHLQPAEFAGWIGAILFLSGVLGAALGGLGADLGHKTGRRGGLLLAAVLATGLGVPAALFPIMPGIVGFQVLFFCLLLAGAIVTVVASTAVAVLIPNEERGASMAAFSVINAIIGGGLAPTVVTAGSALLGGEQHLAPALAATGLTTGVLSLAGYILAMRNAPKSATEWR